MLMTYQTLTSFVPMRRDDGGVNLPRPYGEGFDLVDGLDELIDNRLERMERARRFWGRLSDKWVWGLFRNLIPPLMIITTIAVMSLTEKFNPSLASMISVILTTIFVIPYVITRNLALWFGM